MDEKQKKINTVTKLLAKAADPATTDAERENIMEKVTEMMIAHGIEEAVLNASKSDLEREVPKVFEMVIQAPYADDKMTLLNNVAIAFGCKVIKTRKDKVSVIGFLGDFTNTYMLYNSLIMQLVTAIGEALRDKPEYMHGRTFTNSFVKGFVAGVCEKLRIAYKRAKQEASKGEPGTAVALFDRDQAVKNLFAEKFPFATPGRATRHMTDSRTYDSGRAAGTRADVGSARVGNNGNGRKALGS